MPRRRRSFALGVAAHPEGALLYRQAAAARSLAFLGDGEWPRELLDFVTFERACCPFYSFGVRFPPPHEAI